MIFKIIGILIASATKFMFAPLAAKALKFPYHQTIIITIIGGWIGVLAFYYLGTIITTFIHRFFPPGKNKKKFTMMNKFIVKIKIKSGIIGLAIITPCIISIPVGCIIAARLFAHNNKTIPLLLISVVFWSFALTTFYYYLF
jgi:membrane protein DedA with SNARE-associated domain